MFFLFTSISMNVEKNQRTENSLSSFFLSIDVLFFVNEQISLKCRRGCFSSSLLCLDRIWVLMKTNAVNSNGDEVVVVDAIKRLVFSTSRLRQQQCQSHSSNNINNKPFFQCIWTIISEIYLLSVTLWCHLHCIHGKW